MTWVRLEDGFTDHPKIDALSADAFRLHVSGICYSARHLTDGRIPTDRVPRLTPTSNPDATAELVLAGLWTLVDGGYLIHDYLDYNPSREAVEADRARKQAAGRLGAGVRWGGGKAHEGNVAPAMADAIAPVTAVVMPAAKPPVPSRPVPSPTTEVLPAAPANTPSSEIHRAQALTAAYTEAQPMSKFPAVLGIVRKALATGHEDSAVAAALARIAAEGRSLTVESLRVELQGFGGHRGDDKLAVLTRGLALAKEAEANGVSLFGGPRTIEGRRAT